MHRALLALTGRRRSHCAAASASAHARLNRRGAQVLRFSAFFEEKITNSPKETSRVRKCVARALQI
jgi:hypothetical protein